MLEPGRDQKNNQNYWETLKIKYYNVSRILSLGFLFKDGRRLDLTSNMVERRLHEKQILEKKLGINQKN